MPLGLAHNERQRSRPLHCFVSAPGPPSQASVNNSVKYIAHVCDQSVFLCPLGVCAELCAASHARRFRHVQKHQASYIVHEQEPCAPQPPKSAVVIACLELNIRRNLSLEIPLKIVHGPVFLVVPSPSARKSVFSSMLRGADQRESGDFESHRGKNHAKSRLVP